MGQTDGQTEGRIAVSLNAPSLLWGHNNIEYVEYVDRGDKRGPRGQERPPKKKCLIAVKGSRMHGFSELFGRSGISWYT